MTGVQTCALPISSTEEVIYTSQEMKSVTADITIKDIMGRDNDNKVYEMRSEDFSTAWPNLFWNTFTTVGEFSVFCKVFSQIVSRNVIVPLPKSQTRHTERAKAPLHVPYVVNRGQKVL